VLTEHGLKDKCAKCARACQKVDFCGFDIDNDGIHAQEHKTHAVMDWPQPENTSAKCNLVTGSLEECLRGCGV